MKPSPTLPLAASHCISVVICCCCLGSNRLGVAGDSAELLHLGLGNDVAVLVEPVRARL